MTALLIAYGVAACVALIWMVVRLVHKPYAAPLWSLTVLVACWAIAFPFGIVADKQATVVGLTPMASRAIQHSLLLVGVNGLIGFFVFSALPVRRGVIRSAQLAVPLVVAIAILVGSALLTPPDARTRDNTVPGVATLFLTADLYMGFGFAVAGFWALAAARRTDARVARGLRISAIGLACIVIADCLFVPAILLRLTNALDAMPDASGTAETLLGWIGSVFFLLPGIVVFLAGVTYPALAQRVAALRLWREHRQADREITPLWTLLMQTFPEHRLERLTGPSWREALSPLAVHQRFYRHVIECRDALVRLSPYLANVDTDDPDTLAAHLPDAIRAYTHDDPHTSRSAAVIAPPTEPTLDGDARALIALARSLKQRAPTS